LSFGSNNELLFINLAAVVGGQNHGIPHLLQAVTLSATLVRFYFCFIIYFDFLDFRIVLFVFLYFIFNRTLYKIGQTFSAVSGSLVDIYLNLNVAVHCDTILFAVLVF
jgi:hypothetical protein